MGKKTEMIVYSCKTLPDQKPYTIKKRNEALSDGAAGWAF